MSQDGSPPPASPLPFRKLRCLVVDDDPFLRLLVTDVLRDMGHEPMDAADPDTALVLLHANNIDVLLTDMRLPYMDGAELAMRARQAYPNLRIVFATAYSESRLPDLAADPRFATNGSGRGNRFSSTWSNAAPRLLFLFQCSAKPTA